MKRAVEKLIQTCLATNQSITFAESCTGGKLAALVVEHAGVSKIFKGSLVCYSNESKHELLAVPQNYFTDFGAVSEETAKQMATAAREKLGVDWAVAITGIAGPAGATPTKPVGTVCMAVSGKSFEGKLLVSSQTCYFHGDRVMIQNQSVEKAALWLEQTIHTTVTNKKQ